MSPQSVYVVLNEVDDDATFHCDALAEEFPGARTVDFPAGERFDPDDADAVVLTGSTAGVYERDQHPWIDEEIELIRRLVAEGVPTLGVCFGHQIVNVALGGGVRSGTMTAGLVEAELADQPLFEGVDPVVPALHGDRVTESGDGLERIASAEHAEVFGTAHRERPVWTVQFHPEISAEQTESLRRFGWEMNGFSWAEVTADRLFRNFESRAGVE
ncbi:type 1 glutamine amidotransferase [Halovenus sp. WSH3]|uniref:Type 1 glutamine amidotransferase n=1 Tax=Halovenus carboxidivorans TaxID=2692199 RepID=A0A6B0T1J9_9EURY|nr:type 1 glutamine amidotransferase [Halovenus carboxidivorans]MXR51835.1 type 1 glutamine amidotransferase [Halovenus carboxidivorans]